jgi:hypothetical protein
MPDVRMVKTNAYVAMMNREPQRTARTRLSPPYMHTIRLMMIAICVERVYCEFTERLDPLVVDGPFIARTAT